MRITGFTNNSLPEHPEQILTEMNQMIIHRGPDCGGTYIDKKISLGFRRLKIIDLSSQGDQPVPNEDRQLCSCI